MNARLASVTAHIVSSQSKHAWSVLELHTDYTKVTDINEVFSGFLKGDFSEVA